MSTESTTDRYMSGPVGTQDPTKPALSISIYLLLVFRKEKRASHPSYPGIPPASELEAAWDASNGQGSVPRCPHRTRRSVLIEVHSTWRFTKWRMMSTSGYLRQLCHQAGEDREDVDGVPKFEAQDARTWIFQMRSYLNLKSRQEKLYH